MKRLLATAFGLALSLPLTAAADDYQTIDKMSREGSYLLLSGIPVGGNQSTAFKMSFAFQASQDTCEKYATLMMIHPGRYIFSFNSLSNGYCTLTAHQ